MWCGRVPGSRRAPHAGEQRIHHFHSPPSCSRPTCCIWRRDRERAIRRTSAGYPHGQKTLLMGMCPSAAGPFGTLRYGPGPHSGVPPSSSCAWSKYGIRPGTGNTTGRMKVTAPLDSSVSRSGCDSLTTWQRRSLTPAVMTCRLTSSLAGPHNTGHRPQWAPQDNRPRSGRSARPLSGACPG